MMPLSPQSSSAAAALGAVETALGHIPPHLATLCRSLEMLRERAILECSDIRETSDPLSQMEKAIEGIRQAIAPILSAQEARPPFDPRQLDILREEGLLESLTVLFEEMVTRTFLEMKAALAAGNAKALADSAHLLKGSAVNFGATPFATTCQALEQQAATASSATLQDLIDQLEENHRELMEALHREIGAA